MTSTSHNPNAKREPGVGEEKGSFPESPSQKSGSLTLCKAQAGFAEGGRLGQIEKGETQKNALPRNGRTIR